MIKKTCLTGGCAVLVCVVLFCGCTEQTAIKETSEPLLTENKLPHIQECRAEYFDANNSAVVLFVGVATDEDGSIVLYSWNLSDGFTTNQQSFIHTFSYPGAHQARLTVMDDKGAVASTTRTVYVYESSLETSKPDETRIIGRWQNIEGSLIEFTETGMYLSERYQISDSYWFTAGYLFFHSIKNNQTLRYNYSFHGDDTLVFYPAGSTPSSRDTWRRT